MLTEIELKDVSFFLKIPPKHTLEARVRVFELERMMKAGNKPRKDLEGFKYEGKPKTIMGLSQNNYHAVATLDHIMTVQ